MQDSFRWCERPRLLSPLEQDADSPLRKLVSQGYFKNPARRDRGRRECARDAMASGPFRFLPSLRRAVTLFILRGVSLVDAGLLCVFVAFPVGEAFGGTPAPGTSPVPRMEVMSRLLKGLAALPQA